MSKFKAIIPLPNMESVSTDADKQIVLADANAKADETPSDPAAELEAKLAWITEKVPLKDEQLMGTQAGAGSGDFHQYRMARRREQFRWMAIEADAHRRKEEQEWEERKRQRESEDNEKLSKNQRKRAKKKEKAMAKKGKVVNEDVEEAPTVAPRPIDDDRSHAQADLD